MGDLGLLRSTGGNFTGAICFENNATATITYDSARPAPGAAAYYLIRCDGGTWADGTPSGNLETTLVACP